MSLKYIMDTMEGVDPVIAGLYTQKDGKYVLSGIDGVVPKAKLDEFRNNNIDLNNRLTAFGDIKPEDVKELQRKYAEAEIRLKGTEDFDKKVNEVVESRINAFRETATTEKAALETANKSLSSLLEEVVLENVVAKDAVKLGVADTAIDDVILRARTVFTVDGKTPKAVGADGKPVYGKDGVTPLSVGEWVDGLKKTSPHLFKQSETSHVRTSTGAFIGDPSKMTPLQKIQQGLS